MSLAQELESHGPRKAPGSHVAPKVKPADQ